MNLIVGELEFPEFAGVRCNMMPFIQGDPASLPVRYRSYSDVVSKHFLRKGAIGFLTIDESYVEEGSSQRGYNAAGIDRNVHIEVGRSHDRSVWGGGWHRHGSNTFLHGDTEVLIANSESGTCRVWDSMELRYTPDGDLSEYIEAYPEHTGYLMRRGEVARISIFTPHECVAQKRSGPRQFFRVVGEGVTGRETYFTPNPLVPWS